MIEIVYLVTPAHGYFLVPIHWIKSFAGRNEGIDSIIEKIDIGDYQLIGNEVVSFEESFEYWNFIECAGIDHRREVKVVTVQYNVVP